MTAREFLARLDHVRTVRGGWQARCPAHEDENPSLSISGRDGRVLLNCFAGCQTSAILSALGLTMADLFTEPRSNGRGGARREAKSDGRGPCVATYVYTNTDGRPVARKLRFEPGADGRPKDFSWQRAESGKWVDGLGGLKTPLYRLTEIKTSDSVVLTEGEKDADAGAAIGLPCTTSGGVNSWREDHVESLLGKRVVIVADADEPGRAHAQKVAASLHAHDVSVRVVELPSAKDLAAWIERGGTEEKFWQLVESAPEWNPASGAEILDSVMRFIRRFVSVTEPQARAVTLWIVHTHAFEAADCTPYLAINSAEKRSGKTRQLEVARLLVSKPWFTGRVTAAVLIRKIDAEHSTLLLDESDSAFGSDREYSEALRGILNSGYRRGGVASCCVGQGANITYKDFSTFCAKMIGGIGSLPDTVADRSIPIKLKRARRGTVERFREREVGREVGELRAKIAAWAQTNLAALRDARPEIPRELSDRQADVCEPLLSIADLAGGDWPTAARAALEELCVGAQIADDSIGVRLLADVRRVFYPVNDDGNPLPETERIASEDLAESLGAMEDRLWPEWRDGKAITKNELARLLSRFDISPKPVRLADGRRLRGYEREQFRESWAAYLPPDAPVPPSLKRDTVTTRMNTGENGDFQSVTAEPRHASENAVSPNKNAPCHGVTVPSRGDGRVISGVME